MGLKKCPRCELNYIREGEKYCDICKRYMKGEADADSVAATCVECGERPARSPFVEKVQRTFAIS